MMALGLMVAMFLAAAAAGDRTFVPMLRIWLAAAAAPSSSLRAHSNGRWQTPGQEKSRKTRRLLHEPLRQRRRSLRLPTS